MCNCKDNVKIKLTASCGAESLSKSMGWSHVQSQTVLDKLKTKSAVTIFEGSRDDVTKKTILLAKYGINFSVQ